MTSAWCLYCWFLADFTHFTQMSTEKKLRQYIFFSWEIGVETDPRIHVVILITAKFPVDIYLFKFNNRNTRTRHEICSKLAIKTSERRQWRLSDVFIVNFEHISHLVLVFLLLTLNMQLLAGLDWNDPARINVPLETTNQKL